MDYKNLDLSKLHIEKLSKHHDISSFDCSDVDLNEFLIDDALTYQDGKIAITYLCYLGDNLVGYYCLLNDAIELKGRPKRVLAKLGKSHRTYPALKIGRLGVCKYYKRHGIGSEILKIIIGKALLYSEEVGCRFVTVEAYNKTDVLSFYTKNKFKILKESIKEKIAPMYLDILGEV